MALRINNQGMHSKRGDEANDDRDDSFADLSDGENDEVDVLEEGEAR